MSYEITGVPSAFRAPLTAIELIFGQGVSNAAGGRRYAAYFAKMLASGTATAGVRIEVTSEAQAKTLFGAGSEAHRLARMHIRVNPTGKLFIVPYVATSGSGVATATINVVFALSTGTNPLGTGYVTLDVCGELVQVGFNTLSTPTTMGDEFEDKVLSAAAKYSPVTAGANSTGTVPVNAKHAGASQNVAHRITVVDITPGMNVTCLVGGASTALLAGGVEGSTTELSLFQAASAAVTSTDDYYIATPVTVSSFINELNTIVATRSSPIVGKRCRGFYAATAALATVTTQANTQNYERMQVAWMRNSNQSPDEVLAWTVATFQREEEKSAKKNFKNFSAGVFLTPVRDSSVWPDLDDINDAMNDGIMTLVSTDTGVYLSAGITNASKDSLGSTDDFRANLSHRVSIMDYIADIINRRHNLTFTDFSIVDDPLTEDGQIDLDSINDFDARTTCPFLFKKWYLGELDNFFPSYLQNQPEWETNTTCRVDPANNTRMQTSSSGRTVDVHLQSTFNIAETTAN